MSAEEDWDAEINLHPEPPFVLNLPRFITDKGLCETYLKSIHVLHGKDIARDARNYFAMQKITDKNFKQ